MGQKNSKPGFLIEWSSNKIKNILWIQKLPYRQKNISFEHVKWPSQSCRLPGMAISVLKSDCFNSIFRVWSIEVPTWNLDPSNSLLKILNWWKDWPPSTSLKSTVHRCNSAATQICCNYPWSPKGRKNIHGGDQRKILEKKNWEIFFYKTFF